VIDPGEEILSHRIHGKRSNNNGDFLADFSVFSGVFGGQILSERLASANLPGNLGTLKRGDTARDAPPPDFASTACPLLNGTFACRTPTALASFLY
jgi:hypothetical protein